MPTEITKPTQEQLKFAFQKFGTLAMTWLIQRSSPMEIPPIKVLMAWILQLLADNTAHSLREISNCLAANCDFTEEQIEKLFPAKKRIFWNKTVARSLANLCEHGLIETAGRGRYKITPLGLHMAAKAPMAVDQQYLRSHPVWARWKETGELHIPGHISVILPGPRPMIRIPAIDISLAQAKSTDVPKPILGALPASDKNLLKDPRNVRVWFATNRKPNNPENIGLGFSNKEDEATHHGICVVNIPCGLKTGTTKPGFFESWRKGTAGIVVKTISGMPEPDFWSGLEKSLEPSVDENSFLLFLHGYKVTFENAAIRTAQLKYDLHIPHAAFYSWPSKAWYIGYDADIRSVEASVPRMAAFISQLAKLTAGRQIKLHVVAHSMGNLGLLLALERVLLDLKGVAPQFGLADVVFAAPDVDRVKFIDYVPRTTAMFQQQTLYASRKDKALWLSGWPRLATRAGKIPPVTIAKQTDTIDVAELDLSWLGHGYVAELRPVLTDMFNSMHYGAPPGKRPGLGDAQSPAGNYWTLI